MPNPLADKVRAHMDHQRISRRSMARALHMDAKTVNDFVNGTRTPHHSTRIRICQHLGLDPETGDQMEGNMHNRTPSAATPEERPRPDQLVSLSHSELTQLIHAAELAQYGHPDLRSGLNKLKAAKKAV